MKIFISADIEGVTGVTHWDETEKDKMDYREFQQQMTDEVNAACQAALVAGATEIWIKDAHGSGRNLLMNQLPKEVRFIRGWSGHPFYMVQELDESFDAVMFIGYHAASGSDGSPLAHTSTPRIESFTINGQPVSEFLFHALAASLVKVPVAFVSGDQALCDQIQSLGLPIRTLAVKKGTGNSTISIHPQLAVKKIRDEVEQALKSDLKSCVLPLADHFEVEMLFSEHRRALKAGFYPGAKPAGQKTIKFETDDYFEILRMFLFV
jgi:D-amino peptidase